jgi:GxxExxY protein
MVGSLFLCDLLFKKFCLRVHSGSCFALAFARNGRSICRMHPNFSRAAGLTSAIIGAAIEVHRDKGPGLIESIYQWCLEIELGLNKLAFVSQKLVTVSYKGFSKEEPLRFDVLVEGCVLVEAKAVVEVLPIHKAQLLSYLS